MIYKWVWICIDHLWYIDMFLKHLEHIIRYIIWYYIILLFLYIYKENRLCFIDASLYLMYISKCMYIYIFIYRLFIDQWYVWRIVIIYIYILCVLSQDYLKILLYILFTYLFNNIYMYISRHTICNMYIIIYFLIIMYNYIWLYLIIWLIVYNYIR